MQIVVGPVDKLLPHLEFLRLCVNMRKSILAPSQSNVSGSVLRLKAVEIRARPAVCLPCAFSNWAVYYTCARTAVLAEISSHLDGVDFGPFAHRGLPRLHRSSEAVPLKSLQPGGGSPGLGDVTCRGHD